VLHRPPASWQPVVRGADKIEQMSTLDVVEPQRVGDPVEDVR
jgi:hypothetical protein